MRACGHAGGGARGERVVQGRSVQRRTDRGPRCGARRAARDPAGRGHRLARSRPCAHPAPAARRTHLCVRHRALGGHAPRPQGPLRGLGALAGRRADDAQRRLRGEGHVRRLGRRRPADPARRGLAGARNVRRPRRGRGPGRGRRRDQVAARRPPGRHRRRHRAAALPDGARRARGDRVGRHVPGRLPCPRPLPRRPAQQPRLHRADLGRCAERPARAARPGAQPQAADRPAGQARRVPAAGQHPQSAGAPRRPAERPRARPPPGAARLARRPRLAVRRPRPRPRRRARTRPALLHGRPRRRPPLRRALHPDRHEVPLGMGETGRRRGPLPGFPAGTRAALARPSGSAGTRSTSGPPPR